LFYFSEDCSLRFTFAAIGAAVDNETDTAVRFRFHTRSSPVFDDQFIINLQQLALWFSLIPFTSPLIFACL
jgi:hypothetical protein